MSGILQIEGGSGSIVSADTGLPFVYATYKGRKYQLSGISGFPPSATVLHFTPEDRRASENSPAVIVVPANLNMGKYATPVGLARPFTGKGKPEFFTLGDLEVKVTAAADEALRRLPQRS
jgi:hypothetical protein